MALVMIAIIENKYKNTEGYRLIDPDTYIIRDVTVDKVLQMLKDGVHIFNLRLNGNEVECYGDSQRYTKIEVYDNIWDTYTIEETNSVGHENSNDTVISVNKYRYFEVAFYNGNIISYSEEQIIQSCAAVSENKFSNIYILDKRTNEEVIFEGYKDSLERQIKFIDLYKKGFLEVKDYGGGIYIKNIDEREKLVERAKLKMNLLGYSNIVISNGLYVWAEAIKKSNHNNVIIPPGIIGINNNGFAYCKDLQNVVFNKDLKVIGNHAFMGCRNLRKVVIPDSVTSIGAMAFAYSGVREVELTKSKDFNKISDSVFYMSKLEKIDVPDNVKIIKEKAFASCKKLREVRLGAGLVSIASDAFLECDNLKYVEINSNISEIPDKLFYQLWELETVKFTDSVKRIGMSAFRRCKKLKDLKVNNVEIIKHCAFQESGLQSLHLCNIREIDFAAFMGCESLTKAVILNKKYPIKIEYEAFSYCINLGEVTMHNVVFIGNNAFNNCKKLRKVVITNNTDINVDKLYITHKAFHGCECLEEVVVPARFRAQIEEISLPSNCKITYV